MAGSKSDFLEKRVLDVFIGGATYTPPANLHIALYTTGTLTETSTGGLPGAVEVTGGGYARGVSTNNATNWPAAASTADNPPRTRKSNANAISFPTATADWGNITQWAIVDAATGGNIYYYGTFDVAKQILEGDTATLPPGAIKIYED